MPKLFSLIILVAGIALVMYGINASESLSSSLSRFFTGTPTDKAIWALIGGVVLSIIGMTGLARGSKGDA